MLKKSIFTILIITTILFSSALINYTKYPRVLADILFKEQTETISAIERTKKSVVSIITTKELTNVIFNKNTGETQIDSNVQQSSGGSGIIIESDGLILTNKHVVSGDEKYSVILDNGEIFEAEVVARDPLEDLALIKIDLPENTSLPTTNFANSRNLKIGQTVIAIGYPLRKYKNSASKGIISGLHRDLTASGPEGESINFSNLIQTDASINTGNSGGALIDLNGQVIGINSAIDAGENLGFAITSNVARKAIKSYQEHGKIIRPKLGVRYLMLNPAITKFTGLPRKNGAWIHSGNEYPSVVPDSPAEKAGLKTGDIIFEVNAIKVTEDFPLGEIVSLYEPGQTIGFKVQRGNKIIILKATLGKFE